MEFARRCTLVALTWIWCPLSVFAQVNTGDIVGRVTDTSGGVLPGVTVTVENVATGDDPRPRTPVDTGDYVVQAAADRHLHGQDRAARLPARRPRRVTLASGDRARVDGRHAGRRSCSETRHRSPAKSPLLQTDTSTVGTLFTEKAVQDLPVAGRNIVRLVQMIPGANEGQVSSLANGTRPDDRRQTSSVSINGTADTQNNQLDRRPGQQRARDRHGGHQAVDRRHRGSQGRRPTSIRPRPAARWAASSTSSPSRAPTSSTARPTSSSATTGSTRAASSPRTKPKLDAEPVRRQPRRPASRTNSTFFFVDYEGYRSTQGVANLITVPTARMRTGDFSELSHADLTIPRRRRARRFPGNMIPGESAGSDRAER